MEGIVLYQGAVRQSGETSGLTAVGLGPSRSLRTGKLAISLIPRSLQLKRGLLRATGPLFDRCAQSSRMLSEDPRVKQFKPFQDNFLSSFCDLSFGRLLWTPESGGSSVQVNILTSAARIPRLSRELLTRHRLHASFPPSRLGTSLPITHFTWPGTWLRRIPST
jgi:hypothetical protein